jgi:hypothetical protein
MRSAMIAALSALASLAMVSIASAQDNQGGATTKAPTAGDNAHGLTVEEENAIPYRPCMEAYGWINGHLQCNN